MALTRAEIRAGTIKRESVAVEEWGGDVYLRALSVRERLVFQSLYADKPDGEPAEPQDVPADVWLVRNCTCDEDGTAVFTDADTEWLMDASSGVMQDLAMACLELNGLTADAVEDAEKN